ncbi:MAG: hypothetical protein IKP00_14705 [Victivallales bacterium]|nr:hypothetical protein [Victivallales bacterium]
MERFSELLCSKLPWLPQKDESGVILSTCLGSNVCYGADELQEEEAPNKQKPLFSSPACRRLYAKFNAYFGESGIEPTNCLVASMLPPPLIKVLVSKKIVASDISEAQSQVFLYCTDNLKFSAWSTGQETFRLHRWFNGPPSYAALQTLRTMLDQVDYTVFLGDKFRLTECTFYAHLPAFNMLRYDRYLAQSAPYFDISITPMHASKDGTPFTGFYECSVIYSPSDTPEQIVQKAHDVAMMLNSIECNARKCLLKHYSYDLYTRLKSYYDSLKAHLGNIPENVALNALSNLLLGTELGFFPKYAPSVFKLLVSLTNEKCISFVMRTTDSRKLGAARGSIIAKCLKMMHEA